MNIDLDNQLQRRDGAAHPGPDVDKVKASRLTGHCIDQVWGYRDYVEMAGLICRSEEGSWSARAFQTRGATQEHDESIYVKKKGRKHSDQAACLWSVRTARRMPSQA